MDFANKFNVTPMTELRAGLTTVCDAVELLSLISSQIHLYKLFQNCFSVAARLNHGKKYIFELDSRLARGLTWLTRAHVWLGETTKRI